MGQALTRLSLPRLTLNIWLPDREHALLVYPNPSSVGRDYAVATPDPRLCPISEQLCPVPRKELALLV